MAEIGLDRDDGEVFLPSDIFSDDMFTDYLPPPSASESPPAGDLGRSLTGHTFFQHGPHCSSPHHMLRRELGGSVCFRAISLPISSTLTELRPVTDMVHHRAFHCRTRHALCPSRGDLFPSQPLTSPPDAPQVHRAIKAPYCSPVRIVLNEPRACGGTGVFLPRIKFTDKSGNLCAKHQRDQTHLVQAFHHTSGRLRPLSQTLMSPHPAPPWIRGHCQNQLLESHRPQAGLIRGEE